MELAAETNIEDILATVSDGKRPDLIILDSIQTLWTDMAESAPGTVGCMAECTAGCMGECTAVCMAA